MYSYCALLIAAVRDANKDLYLLLIQALVEYFERTPQRLKELILIHYIDSPGGSKCQQVFFKYLSGVMSANDKLSVTEKSNSILQMVEKLAATDLVNETPFLITSSLYESLINGIHRNDYGRLFLAFVTANVLTKYPFAMRHLKKSLMSGSNMEKFIARTGWFEPKWHDTISVIKDPKKERRIMLYFTLTEIRYFTNYAIDNNDLINANFYLNILIQKFEQLCQNMNTEKDVSKFQNTLMYEVKSTLNVILNHVMTFRGSQESVKVLNYIVKSGLPLEIPTILILLQSLRTQGYVQQALTVVNSLNWETLKGQDALTIVEEIISLIQTRYPRSPKILIGYIASIYTAANGLNALSLLDDLGLLCSVEERAYTPRRISSMDIIQKANVEPHLCGFQFTSKSLVAVYETVLKLIPVALITEETIHLLFEKYLALYLNGKDTLDIFNDKQHTDSVIVILMKYLLLADGENTKMKFVLTTSRYNAAKSITMQYLEQVEVPDNGRSGYLFDMLISVALLKHQDYEFASKVIRFSRSHNIPFSFNQIYPFIMYHYGRNEFGMAEQWYNVLIKHGISAAVGPAKDLYRIARELQWSVNGFVYRKMRIRRNYAKKEEMNRLQQEPIVLIETDDTQTVEDEVTDELISGEHSLNDFGDELSSLLQEASYN
ncbi:uncharacterized protein KQ657_001367 [Scheffersomyces spartinae]|uniref:Uncharacterized protein n=1 Tax=Scheffersomyces spartinae TaxID=45513 RepID=A0A9P8AH36_9ASCO|nr:uncharacterized protein KQ657_001367 [Scheffersomyces spartinae]KAG7192910.1 hypothetical protein KQ657_001367 [Scheffersomyces spartinae]